VATNPIIRLRKMKSFQSKLLIFTALCAVLLFFWNYFTPENLHHSLSWVILAFFSISTFVVHLYLSKSAEGDPKAFVGKFMGVTGLKLFLYLIVLIILLLTDRDHVRAIALYFLVMYFLFTVFEVSSLYKLLRK
jgi:hypothetical protein